MSASLMGTIAIVCFIIAVIFLVISVYLFFHYDIITIYNFLNGKTALREIEELQKKSPTTQFKNRINIVELEDQNKTEKINQAYLKEENYSDTVLLSGLDTSVLNSETIDLTHKVVKEDIQFELEEEIKVVYTKDVISI